MSRPWMPFYVADYLADTGHLSTVEHGAYILLIMHYWKTGGLPKGEEQLGRIVRLPLEQWSSIASTIKAFFDDDWHHDRIDAELEKANEKYEKRANAGRKGGKARAKPEQNDSNAEAMLNQSQSQPHSKKLFSKKVHEDFEAFKAVYPKRAGSNPWEPAKQKFLRAVWDDCAKPEIIIAAARRYAAEQGKLGKVGTEFIMQAKAWLNQKCWQDYAADQFGDANDMVRKSDPRWQFLTARWERENSQTFPKFADKWPFPAAWLIDANNPEWPDAPAFLVRTA